MISISRADRPFDPVLSILYSIFKVRHCKPLSSSFIQAVATSVHLNLTRAILGPEVQGNAIDTVPLVRRRRIALALEDVTQMSSAIGTDDLSPRHPELVVFESFHGARDVVEVCRPTAAALELVRGFVQRGVATGAVEYTVGWHGFVVFACKSRLGTLLTEDAELF